MNQLRTVTAAQKHTDLVILAGVTCAYTLRYGLDLPKKGAGKVISVDRSKKDLQLVSLDAL